MKLLLLAYEFPPIPAAQALRWYYLGNALARRGHRLRVLTVAIHDRWRCPFRFEPGLRIERCHPGAFVAFSGALARRLAGGVVPEASQNGGSPGLAERAYLSARRLLDLLRFPDLRVEWLRPARRALDQLIEAERPDLLIASHEPAVDLLLGLEARQRHRLPLLADLGDPVLAPYSPRWRARRHFALEARVCREVDGLLLTTPTLADLLQQRHGALPRHTVITQGHPGAAPPRTTGDGFRLLYTGQFYAGFRDPSALLAALPQVPALRLVIAGDPGPYTAALAASPQVELLGRRDHFQCLALQAGATALLSLGNRQPEQVPGKVYEYLGAGRPILHLSQNVQDPLPALLAESRRGETVDNRTQAIAEILGRWWRQWSEGELERGFELGPEAVAAWSWSALAERVEALALACVEVRG